MQTCKFQVIQINFNQHFCIRIFVFTLSSEFPKIFTNTYMYIKTYYIKYLFVKWLITYFEKKKGMHREELNVILKTLRYHIICTWYNNEKFDSYLDFFSFLYYLWWSYISYLIISNNMFPFFFNDLLFI